MFILRRRFAALGVVSALLLACGSNGDSQFGSDGQPPAQDNGGNGSDGMTLGNGGPQAAPPSDPNAPPAAACATSTAQSQLEPVYLVFIFDRSGSMKFNPSPNNKWDSVVSGLTSFFGDTRSAGMFASEQVFPQSSNTCDGASYKTPLVAMTALPDQAGTLATTLNANGPSSGFNTPTQPAVQGAVDYAKTLAATGKKTAVVLVTDGEPNGCSSDITNTAASAGSGLADGVKTYVIGVGDSITNLDNIAIGGGTTKALVVSTANPSTIATDFVTVLGQIRAEAISCDYPIPAPPAGETLDPAKVNVQFTSGTTVSPVDYDATCASGKGWHYDNEAAPTKILMCPTSCDSIRSAGGKLDIVFGCATRGSLPH